MPEDARALSTLSRVDYEDAFAVTAEGEHTAEQWVRAVFKTLRRGCAGNSGWGGPPSA